MYGRKVGFTLEIASRRREEEVSYSPETGKWPPPLQNDQGILFCTAQSGDVEKVGASSFYSNHLGNKEVGDTVNVDGGVQGLLSNRIRD